MKKLFPYILVLFLLAACSYRENISSPSVAATLESPDFQTQPIEEPLGIPGSSMNDLMLSLEENIGIPMGTPETNATPSGNMSSVYTNPDIYTRYSYSISSDPENQITGAAFLIVKGESQDGSDFCADAETYFTCCASIQYQTGDTEAAISFIKDNIPYVADLMTEDERSGGVEKVIGDATFHLTGVKKNDVYSIFTLAIANK